MKSRTYRTEMTNDWSEVLMTGSIRSIGPWGAWAETVKGIKVRRRVFIGPRAYTRAMNWLDAEFA